MAASPSHFSSSEEEEEDESFTQTQTLQDDDEGDEILSKVKQALDQHTRAEETAIPGKTHLPLTHVLK